MKHYLEIFTGILKRKKYLHLLYYYNFLLYQYLKLIIILKKLFQLYILQVFIFPIKFYINITLLNVKILKNLCFENLRN